MTIILTVFICIKAMCIEVGVPTPIDFACNDPSYHQRYLAENFPRWTYEAYVCKGGRYA